MLDVLLNLLIIVCILSIAWWALSSFAVPAPFNNVVRVLFALIAIALLLGAFGVVAPLHLYHYRR